MEEKKLVIDWNDKFNLVIEQNPDPNYRKEVFCYLQEKSTGIVWQDIAIVRQPYKYKGCIPVFNPDKLEVCVYANESTEDYTNNFIFGIYKEELSMDEKMEKLSSELFMRGHEAIENFVGYEFPEEDKNVTQNRIIATYWQMPKKEFEKFYNFYFKEG